MDLKMPGLHLEKFWAAPNVPNVQLYESHATEDRETFLELYRSHLDCLNLNDFFLVYTAAYVV